MKLQDLGPSISEIPPEDALKWIKRMQQQRIDDLAMVLARRRKSSKPKLPKVKKKKTEEEILQEKIKAIEAQLQRRANG